ncbi:hypothetical protein NB640_04845 [Oxalobacter vibrioformis]|uniref:Uncharacterized protein n=1 Tax=Oxalobacter vibrioformis TaxID=933080 RepID=A0A9E9P465_9BURK|nr:hypothetical protein [Oxalobacter vibrioformis]WAW10965.1 hypothetical protein NB640_04845 [Oxalobacter vibrioformis]
MFYRKLRVRIDKASVRAVDAITFDFQIDLDIETKGEDICFKEVVIAHRVWPIYSDRDITTCPISRFIHHPGYCILDEKAETFPEKTNTLSAHAFDTAGMKLSAGKYRCVSMIERIMLVRPDDGNDCVWPTDGWTLTVRTAVRKIEIPFCFMVHGSNRIPVFCRDYVAPPVPFVCG